MKVYIIMNGVLQINIIFTININGVMLLYWIIQVAGALKEEA